MAGHGARHLARHMGKHIPGNPNIVPQNMAGAGSLRAANFIYTAAPKDGIVLGSLAQTLALDSLTVTSANIDVGKMPYIGRVAPNIDVGVAQWVFDHAEAAGQQAVRDALRPALAQFQDPRTGAVTLRNTFRWVAARS